MQQAAYNQPLITASDNTY